MRHTATVLVPLHELHFQYSQWIKHQLNVHTIPHIVISKAKDAAFLFTYHTMGKLPCVSRSTKVFFGKSQHSHTARSIIFSIFTTEQMPEFTFSIYTYFCFSSCSRVQISLVGVSSLLSSFGLIYDNGKRMAGFFFSYNFC